VEIWEPVARERIRDTLARYNWTGHAGRLDDLAATFCTDGLLEIHGSQALCGRIEIASFLRGVTGTIARNAGVPPVVLHNVANVLFTALTGPGGGLVLLHRSHPYRARSWARSIQALTTGQ